MQTRTALGLVVGLAWISQGSLACQRILGIESDRDAITPPYQGCSRSSGDCSSCLTESDENECEGNSGGDDGGGGKSDNSGDSGSNTGGDDNNAGDDSGGNGNEGGAGGSSGDALGGQAGDANGGVPNEGGTDTGGSSGSGGAEAGASGSNGDPDGGQAATCYAIRLDQSTANISAPNAGWNRGTGDWTLETWIKVHDAWSGNGAPIAVLNEAYLTHDVRLGYDSATGGIKCTTYGNSCPCGKGTGNLELASAAVNDGSWHHIACERTGGTGRLFIDGAQVDTDIITTTMSASSDIGIGKSTGYPDYMAAPVFMGPFRFSSVARYTGSFDPAVDWTVDASTVTQYLVSNPYNGALIDEADGDNTSTTTTGVFASNDLPPLCASPSSCGDGSTGDESWLDLPDGTYGTSSATAAQLSNTGAETYEAWARVEPGGTDTIVGSFGAGAYQTHFSMGCNNSPKSWFFFTNSAPDQVNFIQAGTCDDDQWHHIAAVRTIASGMATFVLYVDGAQVATSTVATSYIYPPAPVYVGKNRDSSHIGVMHVDEIRISNSARYSDTFTPSRHFDPDANTVYLYHFDEGSGTIANDSSGNGYDLTLIGTNWSAMCR